MIKCSNIFCNCKKQFKAKDDDAKNSYLTYQTTTFMFASDVYILAGGQMLKIMVTFLSPVNNSLIVLNSLY